MDPTPQPAASSSKGPVELHTDSLLLRPFTAADADAVYRICQDPDIQRWTTVPVPYTAQHAAEFVASCGERWASGNPTFAVTDVDSGLVLAAVDLQNVHDEQGPLIGYWVAPEARGKGIATVAVRTIARWAFDELGLPRIRWAAYHGNAASRRVADRVGFQGEGSGRLALEQRGVRRDAWFGALLPSDLDASPRPPSRVAGWPSAPVELRSERLLLRAFRDADAAALLEYARDPQVVLWDSEDMPDLDTALRRVRARADWSSGEYAAWCIAPPDDSDVWGGIVLTDVDPVHLSAEVGYGLLPRARGHRYASEALDRVTRWAFEATALERIALMHAAENGASCAVATASGYALEGVLRRSDRCGDGELHDEHLHSRLRSA